MFKVALNTHKFNNYAFFCPVSRLHLTVSSPVGYANEVTTAILKGLKAKTILDVDGVIDIATGTVKAASNQQEKAPEVPQAPVNNEPPQQPQAPEEPVAPAPEQGNDPVNDLLNSGQEQNQEGEAPASEDTTVAPENAEAPVEGEPEAPKADEAPAEEKPKRSRTKKAEAEQK